MKGVFDREAFLSAIMPERDHPDPDALLFDILPRGEENAIHTRDMLLLVGGTDRSLRKRSEIDRKNGYPVFSSCAGHWRPKGGVRDRDADRASIEHVRNCSLSKINAEWETVDLCNRILAFIDANPDRPLPDRFPKSDAVQLPLVPPQDARRNE